MTAYYLNDPTKLSGAAREAYDFAHQAGLHIEKFEPTLTLDAEAAEPTILVDALLGTGSVGALRENYQVCVDWLNDQKLPIFSLDLPTGIDPDKGSELGRAINATTTCTFIGVKRGLLTGKAPARTGRLLYAKILSSEGMNDMPTAVCHRVDREHLASLLTPREADDHKGKFGQVLIIAGDTGLGGAGIMAGEACLRMGAGLTRLATQAENVSAALARCPELMAQPIPSGQELKTVLKAMGALPDEQSNTEADSKNGGQKVIAIGPGLGQRPWSEQMLQQTLASHLPLVIDADALNLLANPRFRPDAPRDNWVLTPHPGEAARLLACSVAEIQQDRFAAVEALQKKFGGVCLLKGAGTLIFNGDKMALVDVGNPGMAAGGMGDILTGAIAALIAQGLTLFDAAQMAAWIHGAAGDHAARDTGQRGLVASELPLIMHTMLNSLDVHR